MQIKREDFEKAMTQEVTDPRCLHGTRIEVIPTPEGPMFMLRTVSHGDPGPDSSATAVVPSDKIIVTDFGMDLNDFRRLAHEVLRAGHEASFMTPSEN